MDRHTQCAECRSWASGWLRGSFRISSITCGAPSGGQWAWESSAPQRKPRYRALDRALVRRGLTWTTTVYEKRVVFRRSGPHSSEICVAGCVATELEWLHVLIHFQSCGAAPDRAGWRCEHAVAWQGRHANSVQEAIVAMAVWGVCYLRTRVV